MQVGWWHSQAIRFFLRWPSLMMCTEINKARHEIYGHEVAKMVLEAKERQTQAMELASRADSLDAQVLKEASLLTHGKGKHVNGLEETLWWQQEPYIPRPIVSMHVRQGDKVKDMHLFSTATYMWLAERLRIHVPNMKHVWLSSEMQVD